MEENKENEILEKNEETKALKIIENEDEFDIEDDETENNLRISN